MCVPPFLCSTVVTLTFFSTVMNLMFLHVLHVWRFRVTAASSEASQVKRKAFNMSGWRQKSMFVPISTHISICHITYLPFKTYVIITELIYGLRHPRVSTWGRSKSGRWEVRQQGGDTGPDWVYKVRIKTRRNPETFLVFLFNISFNPPSLKLIGWAGCLGLNAKDPGRSSFLLLFYQPSVWPQICHFDKKEKKTVSVFTVVSFHSGKNAGEKKNCSVTW